MKENDGKMDEHSVEAMVGSYYFVTIIKDYCKTAIATAIAITIDSV